MADTIRQKAILDVENYLQNGKKMERSLKKTADGYLRLENKMQTYNRRLREERRAIKQSQQATQKKTSFVFRMTKAFVGADLAVRAITGSLRAMKDASEFVVQAAIDVENWQASLLAVTGSAEEAAQELKRIRDFAAASPLETKDMVEAFIQLKSIGIPAAFDVAQAVGNIGLVFNRELEDVTAAFIGLEKKTLRRLGVEIDRTGQKAVMMSGNMRIETEKTDSAIREGLLEIWRERFPDAMEIASSTTKAKLAIMRSEFFELGASVGEKLTPSFNILIANTTRAAHWVRKLIDPETVPLEDRIEELRAQIKELGNEAQAVNVNLAAAEDIDLAAEHSALMEDILGTETAISDQTEKTAEAGKSKVTVLNEELIRLEQMLEKREKEAEERRKAEEAARAAALAEQQAQQDADALIEKQKQLNALKWEQAQLEVEVMPDGLTKQLEMLDIQYAQEQEKYAANKEALAVIDEIYEQKRGKLISDFNQKLEDEEDKAARKRRERNIKNAGEIGNAFADLWVSSAKNEEEYTKRQRQLAKLRAYASIAVGIANAMEMQPFIPTGLAAAATATAKGAGIIAAGKFADGGIVAGNMTTGDRMQASVNSGEMILNRDQQSRLFDMANGRGITNNKTNITIQIPAGATPQTVSAARDVVRELEAADRAGGLDYLKQRWNIGVN